MDRRAMLGMMGAGAVGLAAFADRAGADDKAHEDAKCEEMSAECLKACAECAKACDESYHHCLKAVADGKKEHGETLQMVGDCGILCGVSAGMIARHSPLMAASCLGTAHATKMTLAHVEKNNSPETKELADKLRHCHKTCSEMVKAMKEHHAQEEKSKA